MSTMSSVGSNIVNKTAECSSIHGTWRFLDIVKDPNELESDAESKLVHNRINQCLDGWSAIKQIKSSKNRR